ncbi:unnamed protein product [Vitrella brassicaformis CCMP3155]|uniref:Uncharacterized protein n=1 Tax=Vitrella brassicaformis (strain CCMP3155) TaxID=1169540 RepID=A0A0G4G3G9_VITBC|nr:unnamed protein product [Vitrella brassicaformis CCMP3155]|eukprot:CEM22596.1 unnamed protein product [Vitrella brassicaformis CCMP3155]
MGLGGYGQQTGFGEGEGMHVCDMGPGMVSGLVEGTLSEDTEAKATSVSPFELKKDRLPAGIPAHGHSNRDTPHNGPSTKDRLADQLRKMKVQVSAPTPPLDSRPPISRRPDTLSLAETHGTDPSPLLASKTISKTPSFPADDSQGDNSTPPKEDKRQVPEEHNKYSRTAQGSVKKSLAAELRRSRKALSTHPIHTAIATASPPAKMTIDHSPVPSPLLPSPTVSQHDRYRLSSPPNPPQEPDPFASGHNTHGMVLRQNRKKRTRSPLPPPSPTGSDHQPHLKAKRAAVRRPKTHEKDETPPVFGGLGEEVLWDPWNKGRQGEIVKTAEDLARCPLAAAEEDSSDGGGGVYERMEIDELAMRAARKRRCMPWHLNVSDEETAAALQLVEEGHEKGEDLKVAHFNGIPVLGYDIVCLADEDWLNDELVNITFALAEKPICRSRPTGVTAPCSCCSTDSQSSATRKTEPTTLSGVPCAVVCPFTQEFWRHRRSPVAAFAPPLTGDRKTDQENLISIVHKKLILSIRDRKLPLE